MVLFGVAKISEISGAGEIPLIATSLDGSDVTWEWGASPDPTHVYSFYRGSIDTVRGGGYDHGLVDPSQCGLADTTTTVGDGADGEDSYYLVAAHKNGNDGPLGPGRPGAVPQCP